MARKILLVPFFLSLFICQCGSKPLAGTPTPAIPAPEQIFADFQAALEEENIDAAIEFVHPAGQDNMCAILERGKEANILIQMAADLDRLSSPQIGENIAQYEINVPGDDTTYPITFMKYGEAWKIHNFGILAGGGR